jgi:hypothetical protein
MLKERSKIPAASVQYAHENLLKVMFGCGFE